MSKETARAALETLTDEEAELLNSDPELLTAFKKKHGLGEPESKSSSMIERVAAYAQAPGQDLSPQGMLAKVPEYLSKAGEYAGDLIANEAPKYGVDPMIAAGVGTAATVAPDLLMMASPGGFGAKIPRDINLGDAAVAAARRGLGFQKSMLKTPFARRQANAAAKIALDEGVVSKLGSPDATLQMARAKLSSVGTELGDIGKKVGDLVDDDVQALYGQLDNLKATLVKGRGGPTYDALGKKLDEVKEDIAGLMKDGRVPSYQDILDLKKRYGGKINYLSDLATQQDTKATINAIEKGFEQIVEKKTDAVGRYRDLKKIYGGLANAVSALSNEVAGQQGNQFFSLPSTVMAAGGLANGPVQGLVAGAAREIFQKRLPLGGARALNAISNAGSQISPALSAFNLGFGRARTKRE